MAKGAERKAQVKRRSGESETRGIRHKNGGWRFEYVIEVAVLPQPAI